jgi:hypothetical protein
MPKVTLYIRKEDIDKWKALDKKTEFIHNALTTIKDLSAYGEYQINQFAKKNNLPKLDVVEKTYQTNQTSQTNQTKIINTPEQAKKIIGGTSGYGEYSGYIDKSYSSRRKK